MDSEILVDIWVVVGIKYLSVFYVLGIVLVFNILFKIIFIEKFVI